MLQQFIVVAGCDRVEKQTTSEPTLIFEPLLGMHYYDSRGVFRAFNSNVNATEWRLSRLVPGFSQRFTGNFIDNETTMVGRWDICQDDKGWNVDLQIRYQRES
jgi:hypothetical protein